MLLGRNIQYVAYGGSASAGVDDFGELERKFKKAVVKERQKFKTETLSNVRGRGVERAALDAAGGGAAGADVGLDKWLVVTIVVAAEAPLDVPKVRSIADLKSALSELGSLGADDVVAVELLWTPQEEGDYYGRDEMLADYPALANL